MSVLESVLSAVRGKRRDKLQSSSEQYDKLLMQLASGKQVDIDEVATLLDELDKSDSDLQKDVETKQRRLAAGERLKQLRKVAATVPGLADELKRLDDELTQIIAEKKPAIAIAAEKLRAAELQADMILGEEDVLRSVGVPISVQVRQKKLQSMLDALKPLNERYEQYTSRERGLLPVFRQRLDAAEQQLTKATDNDEPGNIRLAESKVDSLKREIAQLEHIVGNFEPLRLEIETLRKSIDEEQRLIEAEILKP